MPRLRLPGPLAVLTASLLIHGVSSASSTGTWSDLTPYHLQMTEHISVYDSMRDRMIFFGGAACGGIFGGSDTWAFDLTTRTWQQLATTGGLPPARGYACGVYDLVHDRLVVFGGYSNGTWYDDVWALSFSGTPTWTQLTPAGIGPSARSGSSAIYDIQRGRMVVYGGGRNSPFNDMFALDLSDDHWDWLGGAGALPAGRRGHVAVYDAALDRMLVFGGQTAVGNVADTYAYDLSAESWTQILTTGSVTSNNLAPGILDPVRNRLIIAGTDTEVLDLATSNWTVLPDPGPPVSAAPAIYDPGRDLMIINEDHALDLATLTWSSFTLPQPLPRLNPTAIYDPIRDRMIVYGGRNDQDQPFGDLWAFNTSGSGWTQLTPAGPAPPPRFWHTAIYDPIRDRMLVYGGWGALDASSELADVWELSLSGAPVWTELHPTDSSPPHSAHTSIYDPVGDRMIVWGGSTAATFGTLWALSLADPPSWTQLGSPGGVAGDYFHVSIYDPLRNRMIVRDREDYGEGLKALGLQTLIWNTNMTSFSGNEENSSGVYDPVRNRAVFHGGYPSPTVTSALDLSVQAGLWSALPSNVDRREHAAIYDPVRDRMIVFGGGVVPACGGGQIPQPVADNNAWALTWGEPATPTIMCGADVVWQPGTTMNLDFAVQNVLAGTRAIEWKLECERDWPGLPLRGIVPTVAANATRTLTLSVPVPDTVTGTSVTLRFISWYSGGLGNNTVCERHLGDVAVGTESSLISADTEPGLVRLRWYVSNPPAELRVLRSSATEDWRDVGAAVADGEDQVSYVDRDVRPSIEYLYRLATTSGTTIVSDVRVLVPSVALALERVGSSVSLHGLRLAVTLPDDRAASLEMFDVTGRKIASKSLAGLNAGRHEIDFTSDLSRHAGVYLVRLKQHQGTTVTLRAVVL
jgi:hypothetical protein